MSQNFQEKYLEKQRDLANLGIRPEFPHILKMDVCNVCNYGCVFCPQSRQTGKIGCIEEDLCLRVIRESYDAGARELCLSMTGEPLMNRNLEQYIAYAKELGYRYVFINTNGYLLTPERSRALLESGLDSIKISINAWKDHYYLIHGMEGYERVLENLRSLYRERERQKAGCKIYISYVATAVTLAEADTVRQDVEPYSDDIIVIKANTRAGQMDEVERYLYAGDDEFSFQFPCSQLFNNVYVTAEGYMIVCCQDFENVTVMADLHQESVTEAWNNPRFTGFRQRYLNKEWEGMLCDNCMNHKAGPVVSEMPEFAGYETSEQKVKDLNKRIQELVHGEKGNEGSSGHTNQTE